MTVKCGAAWRGSAGKVFRDTSQMAEKLTVSRDNSLERTPTPIEADMNS
jgi:hypothetical protein